MMQEQAGGGHIFNLLGAGSDGSATKKYAAYGHTKAGMGQLTKSLAGELEGTAVGVHTISPGMVFTELISSGRYAFGSQGRFFVNTLAEPPSVPAQEIVAKVRSFMLEVEAAKGGEGGNSGGAGGLNGLLDSVTKKKTMAFAVLTPAVAVTKLVRRLVLGEGKDRYYSEDEDDMDKKK